MIRELQEHGICVATYFSNKELHPTTAAYQAHGAEWARLPGETAGSSFTMPTRGDEYGAQMCASRLARQLKENIDTVLAKPSARWRLQTIGTLPSTAITRRTSQTRKPGSPFPDYGGWALAGRAWGRG